MIYSLISWCPKIDIILMSSHVVWFIVDCANHKYHYDIIGNEVSLHLMSSNVCISHVDILKSVNLPNIAYILTRRRSWKRIEKGDDSSKLGDLSKIIWRSSVTYSYRSHTNIHVDFCAGKFNWPIRSRIT